MISLPIVTDEEWDSFGDAISKSRVVLFNFCPIKYKLNYIDKTLPRDGNHASTIGTRFHEFAERFMLVAKEYDVEHWKKFIHEDFTDEEVPMLEWFIDTEIERLNSEKPEFWKPLGVEVKVINKERNLRGIIDRIDLIDKNTINVIEYKTSQKIVKPKLQFEFGFYDILLDSIPELKDYNRRYTVINPRLKQIVSFNPSRRVTVLKKINILNECIETGNFLPICKSEYVTQFCNICTLEEIEAYHEQIRISKIHSGDE